MAEPAVVRALADGDIPSALDLIVEQWPEIPRACQEQMIRQDPWRGQQRSFGAFADGRLVSHARFHHRPVRLGRARPRMTGVCEVVTHPDYRRRGLGHSVLRAALEWMRTSGQHFVMLYTGANSFYEKLGWGTVRQPRWYVPIGGAPRLGGGRYRIAHSPVQQTPAELAGIYEQSCGRHPMALVRTREYWQSWPRWAAGNLWFGLLDDTWTIACEREQVVAYGGIQRSYFREPAISIVEACAHPDHPEALLDVFDDLTARSRDAGCESMDLNLPGDHALVSRLAPHGSPETNTTCMVRVIDLPGMLEALGPELGERSRSLAGPARVRLESPIAAATVHAQPGHVSINDDIRAPRVSLTSAGLASLLLGVQAASRLAEAGEIEAEREVLQVLDVLFPGLNSHYWQIDHF
jgi:predicted acetyltransferase